MESAYLRDIPVQSLNSGTANCTAFLLRQQRAERLHGGGMKHQFVANAHQAFVTQQQLQQGARAGGIDARFGEHFVDGRRRKAADAKGVLDLASGLRFVLFQCNFMRRKANRFAVDGERLRNGPAARP